MTDQYQARNLSEIQSLSNEIQSVREELQELKSMAEKLALQEEENHRTLANVPHKNVDLGQMESGEQHAVMLLQQISSLVEHMNQHLSTISSQRGILMNYQPQQQSNMAWEATPMINGGLPLQQGLANNEYQSNGNEYRSTPNADMYPYNRYTT